MRLIGVEKLQKIKEKNADVRSKIESWEREVRNARWLNPHEIKQRYPNASIIGGKNVVFDIYGNRYRLWVQVRYKDEIVLIKKIGTHDEYNRWKIRQ